MEPQEVFDTVAKHLATQGHRAVDSNDKCFYRMQNGDKCAFGILIQDSEYSKQFELRRAGTIIREYLRRFVPNESLINSLQMAHDLAPDDYFYVGSAIELSAVPSIKKRLQMVAEHHNLSAAILETLEFPEVWK